MASLRTRLISMAILAASSALAAASDISIRAYRSDDTLLNMGRFRFDNGRTVNLTVGIGSGAFHHPDDPPNVIWTVGDRGPNLTCGDLKSIANSDIAACRDTRNARIYLAPSYTPSLYRVLLLDDGTFRITDVITLKDREGQPLNGMPNPMRSVTTEIPFDGHGKPLQQDVHGIDAEAVVRLTDGSFWISDENGPSLVQLRNDGRIVARYVPQGTEKDFEGAHYEVVGSLPAILARRQANRGIEALAMSPDERYLYFILQSPLANPNTAAFRKGRNVRLFKIERTSMQVVGEYVYVMDDPKSFRRDPSGDPADPRISEMVATGLDRLIVLERTEATTKLYEIDLSAATDIYGSPWDDLSTVPSLEQTEVRDTAIVPLQKTLRFDSADFPQVPGKIEGMALLGDGGLALINDDDFGITGARTQIVVVRGLDIADR
ncbi:MAG: esterase-like activity of phytase family protein [Pseudorhodoplanes sp.]